MTQRVLHVLSQRPSRTGSGVTLEHIANHAAAVGWEQRAVIGVPADDPHPAVGTLAPSHIHPMVFERPPLSFPVPGMSDVMPYTSTRFSTLTEAQVRAYLGAWRAHIAPIIAEFRPDIIHSHHIWLMSSALKDIAPDIPVVTHCHATGLRQMALCPHLAERVKAGCRRNDRFVVLHQGHAEALVSALDISPDRVVVVGAGYGEETFGANGRSLSPGPQLLYAGKYSNAKGLPWLLDAVEALTPQLPGLTLHIAGSGAGEEAERLRARMEGMGQVVLHGQVSQATLAEMMRRAAVFVLPSFYEGLPLVCVEAAASGCQVVATDLHGVRQLSDALGPWLRRVPLPRLERVDVPVADDLPAFVSALTEALASVLEGPAPEITPELSLWTWGAVFGRVQAVWSELLAESP
ncbi:MAG: glycosyltransferase family 4 protein [Myxococcota bacterium]